MPRLMKLLVTLTFLPGLALADIAPPPGYVEQCTVKKQQKPGQECVECGTYFRERDKCSKTLAPQGYTHACSTRGASVWSEVWCREIKKKPDVKPQPTTQPQPPEGRKFAPPPPPAAPSPEPQPSE